MFMFIYYLCAMINEFKVIIINVDGYIGESTKREISYALAHGKTVNYLEKPREQMTETPRNFIA